MVLAIVVVLLPVNVVVTADVLLEVVRVGVLLAINVVVTTDGLLITVSSMRSIVSSESPGCGPRESAIF